MAMCRRVCGQATEEDAGKGEWKKKRLKHAQNFVNTVDQKGKHLLCDSVTGYLLSVAIHQYAGHKTCPCCVILS